jgi:hypothetical protein
MIDNSTNGAATTATGGQNTLAAKQGRMILQQTFTVFAISCPPMTTFQRIISTANKPGAQRRATIALPNAARSHERERRGSSDPTSN